MPTHKIVYRRALFDGDRNVETLEDELRGALHTELHSTDYTARIFTVSDKLTKAVINNFDTDPPGVLAEVFQLDPRRELPFIRHPDGPVPIAAVKSRDVPGNEDHMGAPAYLLVLGNHLALIESAGLRGPQLQTYLNALLQSAQRLNLAEHWKLVPKVEVAEGEIALGRGVSSVEIKPLARLLGDAPSQLERRPGARPRVRNSSSEEKIARGDKVLELLRTLGATDAELGDMRGRLSTDLGLEARVTLSVRSDTRGTPATLSPADISGAVASLEQDNAVTVVSPDGKQRGRLVTLSSTAEIDEEGGLLQLHGATRALLGALQGWANRGVIDIRQQ